MIQLAKAQKSVSQLAELSDEMGDQHHRMLKSITDMKPEVAGAAVANGEAR